MRLTKAELRILNLLRDYEAIRKRSFGDSIPPVNCVAVMFLPDRIIRSIGEDDTSGFCGQIPTAHNVRAAVIGFNEDANEEETRRTLLHEMGHLKINKRFKRDMGHGEHWKAEMRRLVKVGELDDWF